MEYRYLGNSWFRVSKWWHCQKCFKKALENWINFFDTTEIYGFGAGEKVFAKVIKELNIPREKIVASTKIWSIGFDPNDGIFYRKHIYEAIKNSLIL